MTTSFCITSVALLLSRFLSNEVRMRIFSKQLCSDLHSLVQIFYCTATQNICTLEGDVLNLKPLLMVARYDRNSNSNNYSANNSCFCIHTWVKY